MTRWEKSCKCSWNSHTLRRWNNRRSRTRNRSGQTTRQRNSKRSRMRIRSEHITRQQNSKRSRIKNRNGHKSEHRSEHRTRSQKREQFRKRGQKTSNKNTKFCKLLFSLCHAFVLLLQYLFFRVHDYLTGIVYHGWHVSQLQVSDTYKARKLFFKIPNTRDMKAKSSENLVY